MGKKTQKKGLVKCMKNDLRNIEQEGGRREGEGQRKGRGGGRDREKRKWGKGTRTGPTQLGRG